MGANASTIIRAREELNQASEAAFSAEEKLKILEEMEQSCLFEEEELAVRYKDLADKFLIEGQYLEALYYAKKSLDVLMDLEINRNGGNHSISNILSIGSTLCMIGVVCGVLKRYDESLRYLNSSEMMVLHLQQDEEVNSNSLLDAVVLNLLVIVELALLEVKIVLGKTEEISVHIRKIVEVKEKTLEEGSFELGEAYKTAYMIYMTVMNLREAHPLCLKALEIFEKRLGFDSVEVAMIRVHLVGLYTEFGEYNKALEQSRLAQSVFKGMGLKYELLRIQVRESNVLIALGRYEEAIKTLNVVLSHKDLEAGTLASAHIYMAAASCRAGKFDDAKKHMKIGRKVLVELDSISLSPETWLINSLCIAPRFEEMSMLYEIMNDFENAIYFTRRALAIPKLPQKFLVNCSGRLASLLILSGKAEQGVSYLELEDVMNKFKCNFGPEHRGLGYAYANLGRAYIKPRRADLAVKYLAYAKSIMDVSLGPKHLKSLETSEALSISYALLGRLSVALEVQEKVVEALRGLGPSVQVELDCAVGLLNHLMTTKDYFEGFLTNNPEFDASELVCMLNKAELKEEAGVGD